jgi:hypothetical protein
VLLGRRYTRLFCLPAAAVPDVHKARIGCSVTGRYQVCVGKCVFLEPCPVFIIIIKL